MWSNERWKCPTWSVLVLLLPTCACLTGWVKYQTDVCHCTLDRHLMVTREALMTHKDPPNVTVETVDDIPLVYSTNFLDYEENLLTDSEDPTEDQPTNGAGQAGGQAADGTGGQTADSGEGTGNQTPNSGEGTGNQTADSGEGTGTQTADSGDGTGNQTADSGDGTGNQTADSEDGTGNQTTGAGGGQEEDDANTEEQTRNTTTQNSGQPANQTEDPSEGAERRRRDVILLNSLPENHRLAKRSAAATATKTTTPKKTTMDPKPGLYNYTKGVVTVFKLPDDAFMVLAKDYGVLYDTKGKPQLCTCQVGSIVEVTMCLKNRFFYKDYEDPTTQIYGLLTYELLQTLRRVYFEDLHADNLYRRILIMDYRMDNNTVKNFTVVRFRVELSQHHVQPIFKVQSPIENMARKGKVEPFTTEWDCITFNDVTPEVVEPRHPTWYLRFLCIPVILALLGAIICATCVGKRDSFYVRMW